MQDTCDVCKIYHTTPPRPAVALPMASRFNQKVAMDLKKWKDWWILHIVDMWSRITVSVFVNPKRLSDVVDKIMSCWIGVFGVMESVISDNGGGGFCSDEMREVCSVLDVEKLTTAADSPFQNGLCKWNHAVIDKMLLRVQEDSPGASVEILLNWANMAKNSLQMWHGFSSYQLVFGKNPNLPNIMCDGLPALEGLSSSEALDKHLNSLHAARKAFVESETLERIRRVLRSWVRTAELRYEPGDRVYYKRDMQERWLGSATVVLQDGKVVFVRHASVVVRVSTNRLQTAGNTHDVSDSDLQNDQCIKHEAEEQGGCDHGDSQGKRLEGTKPEGSRPVFVEELGQQCSQNTVTADHVKSTGRIKLDTGHLIRYKVDKDDPWIEARILSRGGKVTGANKNWYNIKKLMVMKLVCIWRRSMLGRWCLNM